MAEVCVETPEEDESWAPTDPPPCPLLGLSCSRLPRPSCPHQPQIISSAFPFFFFYLKLFTVWTSRTAAVMKIRPPPLTNTKTNQEHVAIKNWTVRNWGSWGGPFIHCQVSSFWCCSDIVLFMNHSLFPGALLPSTEIPLRKSPSLFQTSSSIHRALQSLLRCSNPLVLFASPATRSSVNPFLHFDLRRWRSPLGEALSLLLSPPQRARSDD